MFWTVSYIERNAFTNLPNSERDYHQPILENRQTDRSRKHSLKVSLNEK